MRRIGIVSATTEMAGKNKLGRPELVSLLQRYGYDVVILSNMPAIGENSDLMYMELPFGRANTNPLDEVRFISQAKDIISSIKLDVILIYGLRLAPSVALAAYLAGVKRIYAVINGTGTLFNRTGIRWRLKRALAYPLLYVGLKACNKVGFHNADNMEQIIRMGLLARRKAFVTHGSGVNLQRFTPTPLSENDVFMFVGRVAVDKGIKEFIAAARVVKAEFQQAKFIVIGPMDERDKSADLQVELQIAVNEGVVDHVPWSSCIEDDLSRSFVYVLPSYHEGLPRTVIEAMASGRPILTTDVPGCRDTVEDGTNGFLVPAGESLPLVDKMIWFIRNRNTAELMGKASRKLCEERFDLEKVNEQLIRHMDLQ